jgi:archaellum component FlaF (FlaF/FlaG flagellin family)
VTRFIDHLYTRLGTTSDYRAIADLRTLEITRAHTKSSQSSSTSHFLVTASNNGDSSVSVLMSLLSGEYPTTDSDSQLTFSLVYNISARTTQKHPVSNNTSIVTFVFVAAETCLPNRWLETALRATAHYFLVLVWGSVYSGQKRKGFRVEQNIGGKWEYPDDWRIDRMIFENGTWEDGGKSSVLYKNELLS